MAAWPKSLLSFGANVLTARTASRLRRGGRDADRQAAAWKARVEQLGVTSFWRERGLVPGITLDEFRKRIPPADYETFAPAVARMQRGEADVLCPGQVLFYSASSGTTTGVPKVLPVPAPMLAHFRAGCRDVLLYYTARAGHAGVVRGRHLFLTGSTSLHPADPGEAHRSFVGEWPAIAALNLPPWAEAHLYEPGVGLAMLADWDAKVEAVIARTATRDISLLAGIPPWVLGFAERLRQARAEAGNPIENLQTLWPNLECFVHGGVPIAPYLGELRSLLGSNVAFHEVYAGAEGVYAAQDTAASGELRLMTDTGLYFEFLPLADYDPARLETLAEKVVPLAEVKRGTDYVILITTPAGIARYLVGDIVRFTSTEPPRLMYVGRTALQLYAFEEAVIEKDITDVLVAVCQRHRWVIVNFHVAPLFGLSLTGQSRGRHEWWIELKPGTVETPTGPQMALELDAELQRLNPTYAARRKSGRMEAPYVRLVMPGVFRHWMRFHHRWGGQNKLARCRSDRLVADELAQITKFARD